MQGVACAVKLACLDVRRGKGGNNGNANKPGALTHGRPSVSEAEGLITLGNGDANRDS